MTEIRAQIATTALALALGALVACGGDDEPSDSDTKTEPAASTGSDGGGAAAPAGGSVFKGVVVQSTNTTATLAGVKVSLFDIATGALVGDPQTSDGSGKVTFQNRIVEKHGLFVHGNGDNQDTWNFPPASVGEEELVRMGSTGAASLVPGLAGYTSDQKASPVAGSAYWHNPKTNKDEFVGCLTIDEENGVKDVRYFKETLPTSLANRAATAGTVPPKGDGSNDQEAGKFFIGNVEGGKRVLTGRIKGEVVGTVTYFITPRSMGSTINTMPPVASNLTLGSLWVDKKFTANPTPADCK